MDHKSLKILQVSTADIAGGAEKVAWQLFQEYNHLGYDSWLAVGLKQSNDSKVITITDYSKNYWSKACALCGNILLRTSNCNTIKQLSIILQKCVGYPKNSFEILNGREVFNFPDTWRLLDLTPEKPEILHCHNLHGAFLPASGYFDLRALPWLSRQIPTIVTLHDAWMLSGHCAHSFGCERWKTGCGNCHDLTSYPPLIKDRTKYNWERKRDIFKKSQLYIATPSQWLMDKVNESILKPAIVEAKVIPNGVDTAIFCPYDKIQARKELGLPLDHKILLFAANGIRANIWKDYKTLRIVISKVAELFSKDRIIFIALGDNAPPEKIGKGVVQFVPFQKNPYIVARYYQASDVYIHAAREEVWGLTITEAMACGTPVVATAVGGIPEQILDGSTGFLVPRGNAEEMASRVVQLLWDDNLRYKMVLNASKLVSDKFCIEKQANEYLKWYKSILENR